MKSFFPRRLPHFTAHLAALLALLLAAPCAMAQSDFPDHPLRLVIGFPPGTATDAAARVIATKMADTLKQQVIVDNKPGAGTNIAAMAVVHAAPDGYTLFMLGNSNTVNPALLKSVPFDVQKDFAPVALAATVPSILVVNPSLGVNSVAQLIAAAKARPGKIFFASSGNGTMSHLAGELFGMSTGAKMTHVPYKGSSQAVTDLLAGTVPVMFAPASTVLPFVHDGKLKALASTGATRARIAPDLPTIAELGVKNYDTRIWFGVAAPAATPAPVMRKLAEAVDAAVASDSVRDQLAPQGIEPYRGDARAFAEQIDRELKKWSAVIKAAGIQPD
ncbi:MAG TPA: tripartite tricarboxylate transporter substrate binding protein [Burkholderiales bacterium]|nr:tripartite tricarboxylate transporter substrate binding protein [Burkholderiales bacterium]